MPCAPLPPEPLQERQILAAERGVSGLLGSRPEIGGNDHEDIVQMVLVRWTRYSARFDEAGPASIETYIWTIARNVIRDLERAERAQKRGGGRIVVSLDRPLNDDSETTLADFLADGGQGEPFGEAVDHDLLRQAIARFRRQLIARDRAMFDAFGEDPSPTALAVRLGLPRSTVYDWLARIRRQAEEAGLRRFLE